MDLGVFSFSSTLNYILDKKKKSIALFKRGFGGRVLSFYYGEKYYCSKYFELEYIERTNKYKKLIESGM